MAWSFATGTSAAADGASIQPQLGTYSSGYLGICVCATYASDDLSIDQSWQTLYEATHLHIFYKTLGSSETNPTITGASNTVVANILTIGGHNGFGTETAVTATGTDATIETASFSTNLNAELVIMAYGVGDNNSISGNQYGNLDGNTGAYDIGSNSGSDAKAGWIRGTLATAGSVGSMVVTQAASDSWRSYTFTVKPGATTHTGVVSASASASVGSGTPAKVPASHKAIVATAPHVHASITAPASHKALVATAPHVHASTTLNTRDEIYIQRKKDAGSYALVKQDYWTNSPWTDTGPFDSGSTYYYKARHFDPDTGWSDYSTEDSVLYPTVHTGVVSLSASASTTGTQAAHKAKAATALSVSVSIVIAAQAMSKTAATAPHVHISLNLPCSVYHWGAGSMSAAGALAAAGKHTARPAVSLSASASTGLSTQSMSIGAAIGLSVSATVAAAGTVVGETLKYGAVSLNCSASSTIAASPMSKTAATACQVSASVAIVAKAMTTAGVVAMSAGASVGSGIPAKIPASHEALATLALNVQASITGTGASHKALAAIACGITVTVTAAASVTGAGTKYGAVAFSASVTASFNTLDTISVERKVGAGSWEEKHTGLWSAGVWTDTGTFVYGTIYTYRARRHSATTGWSSYSNEDAVTYAAQFTAVSLSAAAELESAAELTYEAQKHGHVALNISASLSSTTQAIETSGAVALSVTATIGAAGGIVAGTYGFGILRFIGVETVLKLVSVALNVQAHLEPAASPRTISAAAAINVSASLVPTGYRHWYAATNLSASSSVSPTAAIMRKAAAVSLGASTSVDVAASHKALVAVFADVWVSLVLTVAGYSWSAATSMDVTASLSAYVSTIHSAEVAINVSAEATVQRVITISAATSISASASVDAAGYVVPTTVALDVHASIGATPTLYTLAVTEIDVLATLVAGPTYIPITGGPNLPVRIAAPQWPYQHRRRHNAPVKRHRVVIH